MAAGYFSSTGFPRKTLRVNWGTASILIFIEMKRRRPRMENQQSTALTQWLGVPFGGALPAPFTSLSDLPLLIDWSSTSTDHHLNSTPYGTANFTTSVEVTGDLSPQAELLAMHRLSEKNGLHEQPVIRRSATYMAFATRQKILDPIPLIVA
jgi:hypothetical protein